MGGTPPPSASCQTPPTRLFCEELQTCIPRHHATSLSAPAPLASALAHGVLGPPGGDSACFSDFCLETGAQRAFSQTTDLSTADAPASRHTDSVSPS